MDPKIKSEFEKAAASFEEAEQQKKTAEQERVSVRQQFEATWRDKCLTVVLPALEQISGVLKPKGWDCEVANNVQSEMSATITIHKGRQITVAGSATRFPYVTFVADKAERTINVRAASVRESSTVASHIPLEQVTEQFVQEQVLKIFQRIASGT